MNNFRVWDIEARRFRYDCFLASSGELWFNDAGRFGSLEQIKFAIQFSTGLTDESGVEIYHDDIVQVTVQQVLGEDIEVVGVVDWDKSDSRWVIDFPERGEWIETRAAETIKVIGNIYEHPHLLETKAEAAQ